ncbi:MULTISPECIES: aminotransferase class IV [Curtobacterium]|uniref:aminotransferase class IV n=1 Tax=Curtobacterium TaxID=2034 RepID=UPI00119F755B|nr:aminotransferase class IV [Curtobacterium pusillum]
MSVSSPVVLVDGAVPSPEQLAHPALVNYGHFTAMQVRKGATRGLQRHLRRLASAHLELFGSALDVGLVRERMHIAVRDHADAYLRVTLYEQEPGVPRVMTVVRPPVAPTTRPQALLPVRHVRPFAHLKHVGSFAQIRYGEQAEREGYHDALLVGPDDRLSETTIANIGFFDDETVVWPDGPSLHGITWQLLDEGLDQAHTPAQGGPITLESAAHLDGAFTANSVGITPVARIGRHRLPSAPRLIAKLERLYQDVPWERL